MNNVVYSSSILSSAAAEKNGVRESSPSTKFVVADCVSKWLRPQFCLSGWEEVGGGVPVFSFKAMTKVGLGTDIIIL